MVPLKALRAEQRPIKVEIRQRLLRSRGDANRRLSRCNPRIPCKQPQAEPPVIHPQKAVRSRQDGVGAGDGDGVLVGTGVGDGVGAGDGAGVSVGTGVGDGVGAGDGVGVSVGTGVGDGAGDGAVVGVGDGPETGAPSAALTVTMIIGAA